jgi:hypothetical protein
MPISHLSHSLSASHEQYHHNILLKTLLRVFNAFGEIYDGKGPIGHLPVSRKPTLTNRTISGQASSGGGTFTDPPDLHLSHSLSTSHEQYHHNILLKTLLQVFNAFGEIYDVSRKPTLTNRTISGQASSGGGTFTDPPDVDGNRYA